MDLSQQAERFFVRNNTYTGALPERSISSSGRYSIAFEVFPVDEVEGLSFRLTATPQGAQSKDTDCQRIIINNLGQRTAFDSPDPPGGGQDNSNLCW
ncbi:type IV pilin protein [Desulfococcaceae bacterium OttesenSCG-928-F15]|nr:type IV pilin protein [Desulfococcaceae bacterium OttesenSCG-928-F15]